MASLHEAVKRPQLDLDSGLTGSWPCPHPLIGKLSITVVPRPALMKRKSALVTIWHHIQPLRGITKCKVRRVRNGYTMEDIACLFACCAEYLCHCHPSKELRMSTSVEANKEAVKSMLTFVAATLSDHDGNQFHTEYTCRPWFAKLENGSRYRFFFISKLRAAAQAAESIEVAVNEPFPSLADSLCWLSSLRRTHWVLAHTNVQLSFSKLHYFWHVELIV